MKDKDMKKKNEKNAILRNTIYETDLKLDTKIELIALHISFPRPQTGLTI